MPDWQTQVLVITRRQIWILVQTWTIEPIAWMLDWQPKVNTYDQSTSAFSGGIDKNGSARRSCLLILLKPLEIPANLARVKHTDTDSKTVVHWRRNGFSLVDTIKVSKYPVQFVLLNQDVLDCRRASLLQTQNANNIGDSNSQHPRFSDPLQHQ